MLRRTAISTLWFVSAIVVHELVWSLTASPRPLGLAIAALVAAFAWIDPFGQFHPAQAQAGAAVGERRSAEAGLATH